MGGGDHPDPLIKKTIVPRKLLARARHDEVGGEPGKLETNPASLREFVEPSGSPANFKNTVLHNRLYQRNTTEQTLITYIYIYENLY